MFRKDEIKLFLITETLEKIQEYVKNFNNADEFWNSSLHFDAVMMNFIALGETVSKISDEFKEKYSHINWYKIEAFRNIIAHDYFGVDAAEVWQIIKEHLPAFKAELEKIQ